MNKVTFLMLLASTLSLADTYISTTGDTTYSINGSASHATELKEGQTITYTSGNGVIHLEDTVAQKKIVLKKNGDSYEAAKSSNIFGHMIALFSPSQIYSADNATKSIGQCPNISEKNATISLDENVRSIEYYREGELIASYGVNEKREMEPHKDNIRIEKMKLNDRVVLRDVHGTLLQSYCVNE